MSRKSNCIQIQVEEGKADARNFPDKIELRATRTLLQTPLPKIENHYFNEHVILLICNYVIYICTSISSNCFLIIKSKELKEDCPRTLESLAIIEFQFHRVIILKNIVKSRRVERERRKIENIRAGRE